MIVPLKFEKTIAKVHTLGYMEILTIVLSSALVSGLVSLLVAHVLEKNAYIRDKKLAVYSEFLEQLDKITPSDELAKEAVSNDEMIEKITSAFYNLEKFVWRIKLMTRSEKIHELVDQIYETCGEFEDLVRNKSNDDKKFDDIGEKFNTQVDDLVQLMNKDISKLF